MVVIPEVIQYTMVTVVKGERGVLASQSTTYVQPPNADAVTQQNAQQQLHGAPQQNHAPRGPYPIRPTSVPTHDATSYLASGPSAFTPTQHFIRVPYAQPWWQNGYEFAQQPHQPLQPQLSQVMPQAAFGNQPGYCFMLQPETKGFLVPPTMRTLN